jgi:hypothetical protein
MSLFPQNVRMMLWNDVAIMFLPGEPGEKFHQQCEMYIEACHK